MKVTKVGINGFGDIGKLIARFLIEINSLGIEVVRINTSSSTLESHASRFNTDSDYQFNLIPEGLRPHAYVNDNRLVIAHPNGRIFNISCSNTRNPEEINWEDCDIIVDSSGKFKTQKELKAHQRNNSNVSKIILTCPPKDKSIPLFAFGVNDENFDFGKHSIISNASCSGNCAGPILRLIHENYEILEGHIGGIHCNTNSEYINDTYHPKEENRGRASFMNTKAISTGLLKSVFGLRPELNEIINPRVLNFRNNTDGSLVNFVLKVRKKITKELFVKTVQQDSSFPKIISLIHKEMTSKDVMANHASSSICIPQISIWEEMNTITLVAYYDNRMGYAQRTTELVQKVHEFKKQNSIKKTAKKILSNT